MTKHPHILCVVLATWRDDGEHRMNSINSMGYVWTFRKFVIDLIEPEIQHFNEEKKKNIAKKFRWASYRDVNFLKKRVIFCLFSHYFYLLMFLKISAVYLFSMLFCSSFFFFFLLFIFPLVLLLFLLFCHCVEWFKSKTPGHRQIVTNLNASKFILDWMHACARKKFQQKLKKKKQTRRESPPLIAMSNK